MTYNPSPAIISAYYAGTGRPIVRARVSFQVPSGVPVAVGDDFNVGLVHPVGGGGYSMLNTSYYGHGVEDEGGSIISVVDGIATGTIRFYYVTERAGRYDIDTISWGGGAGYYDTLNNQIAFTGKHTVNLKWKTKATIEARGLTISGQLSHQQLCGPCLPNITGWRAFASAPYALYFKPAGSTAAPQLMKTGVTGQDGRFSKALSRFRSGTWSVRYAGNTLNAPCRQYAVASQS